MYETILTIFGWGLFLLLIMGSLEQIRQAYINASAKIYDKLDKIEKGLKKLK